MYANTQHTGPVDQTANVTRDVGERCQDYQRMEGVLRWLEENFEHQPTLAEAAHKAGLSEAHFQRLFTRWVGISPKRYVQLLTLERAKRTLNAQGSVLDAALDSGLSGPSRLHDLFVNVEAMSPGEYKQHGQGLRIHYGFVPSPFGECLLMNTARGICGLAFTSSLGREATRAALRIGYEQAQFVADQTGALALATEIFAASPSSNAPLKLLVRGTQFQVGVWRALLSLPAGSLISYQALACRAGSPRAVRAAGTAIGSNPICYLIPCHRVIRKSGALGGYRWGAERKLAMLSREAMLDGTSLAA